jgi:hypothetical protein
MEGVTRLYQQLDKKITDHGGVQNLFGINRKSAKLSSRLPSATSITSQ